MGQGCDRKYNPKGGRERRGKQRKTVPLKLTNNLIQQKRGKKG
jgi:hypothetical protein